MSGRVLVTGGTGALGRVVVQRLLAAGRDVRVLSRRPRPAGDDAPYEWAVADLLSGDGVDDAVADVGVIVHCATAFGRGQESVVASAVVEAAKRAGTPHLLSVSIVGIDRIPLGYYRQKLAAERLIERSGLPYTILRATQFHDLVRALFAASAKAPVMVVPAVGFQPVDVRDVADRLVELAAGEAVGRAPDFGGPAARDARDLARAYLSATGRRRPIVGVRLPGKTFGGLRRGANLTRDHAAGTITFEDYLAEYRDPKALSYRASS